MSAPSDDENPTCSFCGKTRAELGTVVFTGPNGVAICAACVVRADRNELPLAACATCEPVNGKHAKGCPVTRGCA